MPIEQEAEIGARDASASGYAADYRRAKGSWWDDLERKILVEAIGPRFALRVLDAGSGVGRVAVELARRHCTVDAIDFSLESLRVLRQTSDSMPAAPRPVVADVARGLPFPDSVVDAVISGQVVHHIPTGTGRLAAWLELARVAKSGAQLALIVYKAKRGTKREGYFSNGIFFHRYRLEELANELVAGGWRPIRISAWYRVDWPAFAPILPTMLESWCARMHIADDRATYLFVHATKAG